MAAVRRRIDQPCALLRPPQHISRPEITVRPARGRVVGVRGKLVKIRSSTATSVVVSAPLIRRNLDVRKESPLGEPRSPRSGRECVVQRQRPDETGPRSTERVRSGTVKRRQFAPETLGRRGGRRTRLDPFHRDHRGQSDKHFRYADRPGRPQPVQSRRLGREEALRRCRTLRPGLGENGGAVVERQPAGRAHAPPRRPASRECAGA